MYGDSYLRPRDPIWDVNLPMWNRLLFGVGVIGLQHFKGQSFTKFQVDGKNLGIYLETYYSNSSHAVQCHLLSVKVF